MEYEVYNVNQFIRRLLMEEFCDPSSSKGYDEFSLYMDMLKREHPDLFRMILSALYPVFYLENSIKLLEVETIEDENIEEEAELYVISREALLDVTTLDDVVNLVEEEDLFLDLLLENNEIFFGRGYLSKRSLFLSADKDMDRYFLNISPSYMYEKMDCCIEITTKNILDIYLNSYMESKYEEVLFKRLDAASNATKFLSNLRTYDTDNFLLLMKTMTEDARDYLNYLKKEDDVSKLDEKLIRICDTKEGMDLYNTIMDDSEASTDFFLRYSQYSLLDEGKKQEIDKALGIKKKIK
ncbi:MAG: hypothetical protein SPI91_05630 [Bacilli bacterium]|nr:hypothetical protein [Bacilli bacterium]